jgi:hypothetical protein
MPTTLKRECGPRSSVEQPRYPRAHSTLRPGGWGRVTWGSAPWSTDASATHHPILKQTPGAIASPGVAPSTSTLTAPKDAPSAPGASCTSSAGAPHGTGATEGKYRSVTRHAVGQQTIGADEVRLQSP